MYGDDDMNDIVNDNSVRLAALELIVSELLAHCVSTDPSSASKILKDTQMAKALSPSDTQDHAVFSLVAREFELAIERANDGVLQRPMGQA
jgi:hypothetical protein